MIELSNHHIVMSPMIGLIQKLQAHGFDPKNAYRLHKMNETLQKAYRDAMNQYQEMGVKYAKRDEKGELLKDERGHFVPEDDKAEEYKAEFEKFLTAKISVAQKKVHIDAFKNILAAPSEMAVLEPLVEGLETV